MRNSMDDMKLEVIGREVIKPASPAPQDHLHLSLLDFSVPPVYVTTIFFYKNLAGESSNTTSKILKSSLSKTLSSFYPLAGRIQGVSINCNDEGAMFTEARTNLLLSDFLKNNPCSLEQLLPPEESAGTWPLLSVKVSFFGSGSGVAVTMAISHKICDAASMLTFAQSWATTTKGISNDVAAPVFAGATIYPPPYTSAFTVSPLMDNSISEPSNKYVTNRFVFKSCKIFELKRKAASESVPVPTRVEAITSLLCKCARNASRSNSSLMMRHAMDLRLRIPSDILSPSAIGNLLSTYYIKKEAESEMEIGEIVAGFRKAKEGVIEIIKESLQGDNTTTRLGMNLSSLLGTIHDELRRGKGDVYAMSSWCNKPFYEVDFGWDTPVWVGFVVGSTVRANEMSAMLMDSKDGEDVEAWVVLLEQDMNVFIRDQELLSYAVLNPPVLI